LTAIDRDTDLLHDLVMRADANPELVEQLGRSEGS
jgi:hypothetical protein